jgi:hypothetical protein
MENSKHVALRALIRPSPSGQGDDNLFVRLSPDTAKRIHNMTINSAPTSESGHRQSDNPSKWFDALESCALAIVDPTTAYGIEFIPLKITVNCETIYASYNGGSLNMIEYNLPQGSCL